MTRSGQRGALVAVWLVSRTMNGVPQGPGKPGTRLRQCDVNVRILNSPKSATRVPVLKGRLTYSYCPRVLITEVGFLPTAQGSSRERRRCSYGVARVRIEAASTLAISNP